MAETNSTRRAHNFQDMTGQRFHMLTVLRYLGPKAFGRRKIAVWECRCDCGSVFEAKAKGIRSGSTKSCGCWGRSRLGLKNASAQVIDPSGRITLCGGHVCLVDPEDLPLVSQFNWTPHVIRSGGIYARRFKPTRLMMHVLLMGQRGVDHKNGNGLDNRRSNLRLATNAQNMANSRKPRSATKTRLKGVCAPRPERGSDYWQAQIKINGKPVKWGRFATEEEAARAYDAKAKEVHGEFAYLNFPEGQNDKSA